MSRIIAIGNFQSLILICIFFISGCDAHPGKVIEQMLWSSVDGSTVIEAKRLAEGTWGNPSNGEHIEVHCKSNVLTNYIIKNKLNNALDFIGRNYSVDKFGPFSKERIIVYSNDIILGTLVSDFFISYDSCLSVIRWKDDALVDLSILEMKRKKFMAAGYEYKYRPNISLFKSAMLCSNDSLVLSVDESLIENNQSLWIVSVDRAKSWRLSETKPEC